MKIIETIKQKDKQKHLLYGFAISLSVGAYCGWWVGLVAALMASLGKEIYDAQGHGKVEVLDVVFTLIGAVIAIPITYNRNIIMAFADCIF